VIRPLPTLALAVALGSVGCARDGSPESVADAFAEAYFQRMDQEKAKEYTALGASAMLDAELAEVRSLREGGYGPAEAAAAEVVLRRGEAQPRDQRLRFPFEIAVRTEGEELVRNADVELTQIDGRWKVVRVGLEPR
jgi:hypothetical protein